jgi:integrase
MASFRERKKADGTKYWSVLYRIGGRKGTQHSLSFEGEQGEADARYALELFNTHGPGRALELLKVIRAERTKLTVDQYLRHHVEHLTGVDKGTRDRYTAFIINDISPHLGHIPLAELSRDDVRRWVNLLAASGSSGKTIMNKHGFLSGALAAGMPKHLQSNPCDGNRLPRWDRTEMVFLTRDEFRIMQRAVSQQYRPLIEFLVASGARWGEATALRPSDVDRDACTVRITRAWKMDGHSRMTLGTTKTRRSVRTINVPGRVLDQLDYSREWLFVNGRGNPVRIHSFQSNLWRPALARAMNEDLAKKEGRPVLTKRPRIHDLRHTCASWMIAAGVPLPVIQQHLGHESITTTVNTYGHLDRSSAEAAAAAISEMLDD